MVDFPQDCRQVSRHSIIEQGTSINVQGVELARIRWKKCVLCGGIFDLEIDTVRPSISFVEVKDGSEKGDKRNIKTRD